MVNHEERQNLGGNEEELVKSLERADHLFAQDCTFLLSAATESGLPNTTSPEFAFAGRSNVGKSSLINALVNRKNLVKTSKTPGRTQLINFFNLDSALMLVDLPGYGYAKASKKAIHEWNQLIEDYLKGRQQLKRVFILIDSRHGIKPTDVKTMELLDEAAMSYQIVMTKIDKISKPQQDQRIKEITKQIAKRPAAFPEVLMTSSEKRFGLSELRNFILSLL